MEERQLAQRNRADGSDDGQSSTTTEVYGELSVANSSDYGSVSGQSTWGRSQGRPLAFRDTLVNVPRAQAAGSDTVPNSRGRMNGSQGLPRESFEMEERQLAQRNLAEGSDDGQSSTTTEIYAELSVANSSEDGSVSGMSHASRDRRVTFRESLVTIPETDYLDEGTDGEEYERSEHSSGAKNQPAYDAFRVTERKFQNSGNTENKIRRCVRLILYILIFCIILIGGVVARVALIWLGSQQIQNNTTSSEVVLLLKHSGGSNRTEEFQTGLAPFQLLLCQLSPLLLVWLSCCFKVVCSRHHWPDFKRFVLIALLDCAGVVGRSVFLFKVLPSTDVLTAVVLGTGVCQVPAVLKMISLCLLGNTSLRGDLTPGRWSCIRHYLYFPLVALAMLVQLAVVPLLYFSNDIISVLTNSDKTLSVPTLWALIVAVLCSSLVWWENFAYGKFGTCTSSSNEETGVRHPAEHYKKLHPLSVFRIEMGHVRQTSYVCTGPIQMIVVVALFFAFNDGDVDLSDQIDVLFSSFGAGFSNTQTLTTHFSVYGLMYMQIAGTFISTFLAGIACRLYMQRMGFALPVQLVAPACMALAVGCTPSNLAHWYDLNCVTVDLTEVHVLFVLVMGIAVWLSTVVINVHVWHPQAESADEGKGLFLFPRYDPIFSDLNLQCRRRQDKHDKKERNWRYKKLDGHFKEGVERPTVYFCATMWHECRHEMLRLLESLFRVDLDIYIRKNAAQSFHNLSEECCDLYEPEFHIIFDDAFETDCDKQRVVNLFVRQFLEVVPEATRSTAKRNLDLKAPTTITTPYGGRLLFQLPGGTLMYVHLKDRQLIRHRPRWSQVMYLYWLLGFRLMKDYGNVEELLQAGSSLRKRRYRHRVRKNASLLNSIAPSKVQQADNIFILTLDGDVDFKPEAVRLLLDRMRKNKQVGAVCGRFHPTGDGLVVWYQKFEYALSHWLQNATEHVFGCVLYCPGCFSLFRGSALMDDNVMKKYATKPTQAAHFIQQQQNWDRWLCTLLLQQGWKTEYCAGADALISVPETFTDLCRHRRYLSLSALVNLVDLLRSWRTTVKMNDNISVLFVLYLFLLLACRVLAPGLIVHLIALSYTTVLEIGLGPAYFLSVVPVFFYVLLCLKVNTQTQINVAAVMSSVYAVVMVFFTVGIFVNVATSEVLSPDVLFLVAVAVIVIAAGILHPTEFFSIVHGGVLYYTTIPFTFVFHTVFFLCNLNVVAWGTREIRRFVEKKDSLCEFFTRDIRSFVRQIMGKKHEQQNNNEQQNEIQSPPSPNVVASPQQPEPEHLVFQAESEMEPDHGYWTRELNIPNSQDERIEWDERTFWRFLIDKYLLPLETDRMQEDIITEDLLNIRNRSMLAFMLLNFIFTLVLLQFRLQADKLKDTFFIAGKYEPVSTVSLGVFSLLLLTQFCGMLGHRWSTFLHHIASTRLSRFKQDRERERVLTAIQNAPRLTSASGEAEMHIMDSDFSDDSETDYNSSSGSFTTDGIYTSTSSPFSWRRI